MDEAVRTVMEALAAVFPRVETMTGAEARAAVKAAMPAVVEGPAVARVETREISGPGGTLRVRVYWPLGGLAPSPAFVFFHGGGFVLCDIDVYDATARAFCLGTRAVVASVDYRLAPEHPFPAATEDVLAAVRWVAAAAGDLGVDTGRIAVAGDSAGGNLAAVAALLARDAGIVLAHQLLIYPILDPTCSGPSHREKAEGFFLTETAVRWYWRQYLGDRGPAADARVAPVRATLAGLAPATIVVAEHDPLRDDGEAYAAALAAAGVAVDCRRAPGMFHGFFSVAEALPAAARFRDAVYRDVGAMLRGS